MNPVHFLALPFVHQWLIWLIRSEQRTVSGFQKSINAHIRDTDYRTTVKLIKLIRSLPGTGHGSPRYIGCDILVNAIFDGSGSAVTRYRAIAEHVDYIKTLGIENTAIAMGIASLAVKKDLYTKEQERALVQLAVSYQQRSNKQPEALRSYRYNDCVEQLILQRHEDAQKIMETAHKHPDIASAVELEAVMDGSAIAPLAGGAL